MVMNRTAEEAFAPIRTLKHPFTRFHDCWKTPNTPGISLLDCYRGMYRAVAHRFFDFETFNVAEYVNLLFNVRIFYVTFFVYFLIGMITAKRWQMGTWIGLFQVNFWLWKGREQVRKISPPSPLVSTVTHIPLYQTFNYFIFYISSFLCFLPTN